MNKFKIIVLCVLPFFLIACDEETDADNHSGGHFEPVKWEIVSNNSSFLIIDEGILDSNYNLKFDLTSETETENFKIVFYDENGIKTDPEIDEHSFAWKFEDKEDYEQSDIVEVIPINSAEFEFRLKPLQKGITKIQFIVYHGDHADLRTPFIDILVE